MNRGLKSIIWSCCAAGATVGVVMLSGTAMSSQHDVKVGHLTIIRSLSKSFAIFDRDLRAHAASTAQTLPGVAAFSVGRRAGLDPEAAVLAGGAYPVWVVPGTTELCLVVGEMKPGAGTPADCGPTSDVEQLGLALVTETPSGQSLVVGLVPNGNRSVEATNSDRSSEDVGVSNNVYEIVGGDARTLTLKTAGGASTTRHLPVLSSPPGGLPNA